MSDKQWNSPPEMTIDPGKTYTISIKTNRGELELELYPEHAPKTVNNFVFLTEQGYYDGVVFHRVISDAKLGSASLNLAVHYEGYDIRTNFSIYDLDIETGEYRVIREGHLDQPHH